MRVETHDSLDRAQRVKATRCVVYDDYDNPVVVVMKMQGGRISCVRVGDKRFQEALQMLGIKKTVIVDKIDAGKLPTLSLR